MRFDGWDAILFSSTSAAPIQEFKTTCFEGLDDYGREVPTLRSYISSVAPGTPFRISIHNWELPYSPSVIIESRRRSGDRIVLAVQVSIDGAQLFRSCFDTACKWPQEITREHRSMNALKQSTSQASPRLKFPPFNTQILMHTSWHTRSRDNTITVTLSEQLVRKFPYYDEDDLGFANTIVCFAFQHAPRGVLEQAGIAYPIRNPLYFPYAYKQGAVSSRTSSSYTRHAGYPDVAHGAPIYVSPEAGTVFGGPPSRDSRRKVYLPPILGSDRLAQQRSGGRTPAQGDSSRFFIDIDEDVSMSTWSTAPNTSDSTASTGHSHAHTRQMNAPPIWTQDKLQHAYHRSPDQSGHRSRRGKENSILAALEDERLEKMGEAVSPSKKNQNLPLGLSASRHDQVGRPLTVQTSTPTSTRPTLATQGRRSSYMDPRDTSKVSSLDKGNEAVSLNVQSPIIYHPSYSSDKENRNPSQPWLPTLSSHANIAPTPNMFAQKTSSWKPDSHMKNASSIFPNSLEYDQNKPHSALMQVPPAHSPSLFGSIKSRKEGKISEPLRSSDHDVRHDQSLLPAIGSKSTGTQKLDVNHSHNNSPIIVGTKSIEVIDIDAIDPQISHDAEKLPYFRPSHKPGMSSIDSTMRLERKLYSALGEELGSFDHQVDTTIMGPELAQALTGTVMQTEHTDKSSTSPAATDSDSAAKRKRQGTLGGERGRSPMTKKEKSKQGEIEVENVSESGMPP